MDRIEGTKARVRVCLMAMLKGSKRGWGGGTMGGHWTVRRNCSLLAPSVRVRREERSVLCVSFGGVREDDVRAKTPLSVGRGCSAGKGEGEVCEDMKMSCPPRSRRALKEIWMDKSSRSFRHVRERSFSSI